MEKELKCFDNDNDKVIAYDQEDAWTVWCDHLGEDREDYQDYDWEEVDMNLTITIIEEDYMLPTERKTTKTVKEWIKDKGRGFLCGMDF